MSYYTWWSQLLVQQYIDIDSYDSLLQRNHMAVQPQAGLLSCGNDLSKSLCIRNLTNLCLSHSLGSWSAFSLLWGSIPLLIPFAQSELHGKSVQWCLCPCSNPRSPHPTFLRIFLSLWERFFCLLLSRKNRESFASMGFPKGWITVEMNLVRDSRFIHAFMHSLLYSTSVYWPLILFPGL